MDNQQESLKVIKELSWLGGIIDGEGTITIRFKNRKNTTPLLSPIFVVTNTDMEMIDEICRILKKNEVGFWITEKPATGHWKSYKTIEVAGIKRLSKFLPIIEEYLIAKREECSLVREWCMTRVDSYNKYRNHKYYTEYDYKVLLKLRTMVGHQDQIDFKKYEKLLKSSETTR